MPLTHARNVMGPVRPVPDPRPSALLVQITNSRLMAHVSQAVLPTPSVLLVFVSPVTPTAPRVPVERSTNAPAARPIDRSLQTVVVSPPAPRINSSTRRLLPARAAIPVVQVAPVPDPARASPVVTRTTRC